MSAPMRTEGIDNSSSILLPYYDQDTKIMYLAGKVTKSKYCKTCSENILKLQERKKNLSTKNHLLEWQIRKNQGTKTLYKNCTPQPSKSHCNQMFIIIHTY